MPEIINIYGESFSGKTHLSKIFLSKNNGLVIYEKDINNEIFTKLKLYENIIIDEFNNETSVLLQNLITGNKYSNILFFPEDFGQINND